jgi:hypothetical protein
MKKKLMVSHAGLHSFKIINNPCVFYHIQGRKIPVDEYIHRIRTARNPDSTKRFNTTQYLTPNQVD